jgi:uncharacterized protein (DUF362 family)
MAHPVRDLPFVDYDRSVPEALEAIGAPPILASQGRILIKPNLVNASPFPVTLPAAAVEALVRAIRRWSGAEVLVAEGTGDSRLSTGDVFRLHGYDHMARRLGVPLVDLDEEPLVRREDPACLVFPEFWLPRIALECFVVSFAVLKRHSLADVTLSLKNMMGFAPPSRYRQDGAWKKSAFHRRMHESIFELNRYRRPDLAVVDASVGLAEHHLGGPRCEPPAGRILAGFDPVAVDAAGARLLGVDWKRVGHIRMAHGMLGDATAGAGA